jgi:hypothetical protein
VVVSVRRPTEDTIFALAMATPRAIAHSIEKGSLAHSHSSSSSSTPTPMVTSSGSISDGSYTATSRGSTAFVPPVLLASGCVIALPMGWSYLRDDVSINMQLARYSFDPTILEVVVVQRMTMEEFEQREAAKLEAKEKVVSSHSIVVSCTPCLLFTSIVDVIGTTNGS